MKKYLLLLIALLSVTATTVNAQNFRMLQFLSCLTMTCSNTANYTNIAPYFGQPTTATTNANGFSYTNDIGTFVTDYTSNTNTGPFATGTAGVLLYTNDQTQITRDILFHADGLGNVCTNYTLVIAGVGNATSTNSQLTFVPILKAGNATQGANVGIIPPILGTAGTGTILDNTNAFTITFNTTKTAGGGFTVNTNLLACIPSTTSLVGLRGLRLLTAQNTNAGGSTTFWEISCATFIGPPN